MTATVTISEKSAEELVRVVRESLHLEDGDRVVIESTQDGLTLRREESGPRIVQEDGTWVFSAGRTSNYSVRAILNELRDEAGKRHTGE